MKSLKESDTAAKIQVLLERAKTQPSATLSLAEILVQQGKAKEALAHLRTIEPDYRESYRFNVILARAYHAAGDIATAKTLLEKACMLAPQNEVALRDLLRLQASRLLQHASVATSANKLSQARTLPSFASMKPAATEQSLPTPAAEAVSTPENLSAQSDKTQAQSSVPTEVPDSDLNEKDRAGTAAQAQLEQSAKHTSPETIVEAKVSEPSKENTPAVEEKLLTESDIFDEKGLLIGEFGPNEFIKEIPEISFVPEVQQPPKYDSVLDLSEIPAQKEEPPVIELDTPKISLDRAKLSQVLSRLSFGEEQSKIESATSAAPADGAAKAQNAIESNENKPSEHEHANGAQASHVTNVLKSETLEKSQPVLAGETAPALKESKESADEIEVLAAELSKFKAPPVQETNDPTPLSEQRKPFDDDEEIKVPTRQLAEIFVAQGAFAKAIKVYEALAQKEPHNALLFNIIINGLRAQMK
ncbi:MAG: hypothetical protein ACK41G_06790 [Candidatus Thermochlorobacter sp.]